MDYESAMFVSRYFVRIYLKSLKGSIKQSFWENKQESRSNYRQDNAYHRKQARNSLYRLKIY